jgi:hypothetical protein
MSGSKPTESSLLLISVFKRRVKSGPAAAASDAQDEKWIRVAEVENLSRFNWFTGERSTARQLMRFTARTVASSSKQDTRTSLTTDVNDEKFACFALTTDQMSYVVVAEGSYPRSTAYQLIEELRPAASARSRLITSSLTARIRHLPSSHRHLRLIRKPNQTHWS